MTPQMLRTVLLSASVALAHIAASCSYSGGFVGSTNIVVHLGEKGSRIKYQRTVSGKATASPDNCAPSAPIPLYKKAMASLHRDAQLGPNEVLMHLRQDLVRRQTGNAVCRLYLVVSADVYRVRQEGQVRGTEKSRRSRLAHPKDPEDRKTSPRRRAKQGAMSIYDSSRPSIAKPRLTRLAPSAGEPGTWTQLRGRRLDRAKEIWLVERRGKWRALAVRRLSSHVILIRIPSDTRGGTIGYSFGKRRRKTKLRYDVVTKRNAASLRDRTKPESISARTAAKALKPIKSALKKCRGEDARRRRVNVRVTVSGRTGVVSSVEIIGNKGKNLNTGCVRRLVKSVVFPLFELTSHSIAVPLRM